MADDLSLTWRSRRVNCETAIPASSTPRERGLSERLPASELYRIDRRDLVEAIGAFRLGQYEHGFADSTRFDLLVDGDHRIPPKAVVGLASRRVLGRILRPHDFSAGESSPAFRLLRDRGFELVTKQTTIGTLNATFSVGRSPDGLFLLLESKGPARNVDYLKGLEALLYGLADLDATLESVAIDSRATRSLPFEQRRVDLSSWSLPLQLCSVEDLPALRRAITAAVAVTARDPKASGGGGNPTKRIRVSYSIPDDFSLFEVRELLAQEEEGPSVTVREFRFRPGLPTSSGVDTQRRAIEATVVAHRHAAMQNELYEDLVKTHGPSKVAAECLTSAGRLADIVVEVGGGYTTYEIKTARSPRDCIRQALGQLLEYTCWPGSGSLVEMYVVGLTAPDSRTLAYLERLRGKFGLPVYYHHQPVGAEE